MTGKELKSIRRALGLSIRGLAELLQLPSERNIGRWEAGTQDIPGPVAAFMEHLDGCEGFAGNLPPEENTPY